MRKKLLSLLLILSMLISRLPVKVSASPSYELSIGGTDVTYYNNVISYWKADGDGNYSNTGNESDYDFSVFYNSYTESFTLTLNGVEIATSGEEYGIKCNASLDIILADGTENRINATSYGVSADNGITIEGQGNLEITSGDAIGLESLDGGIDIYSGTIVISGASGVFAHEYINIEGGSVTAIATGEDGKCFDTKHMTAPFSYRFLTNDESASEPEKDYTYCPPTTYANSLDYKYVKIEGLKEVHIGSTQVSDATDEVSYWLNNGDGGITSTDANENNYNVKYDNSSNTLTLNGLDLTNFHNIDSYGGSHESCGIYSTVPLNIILADGSNNSINTVTTENYICMIKAGGDITVGGSGTLSLHTEKNTDSEEYSNTNGILSSGGGVAVTGGEITITANNTDDFCGLYAENGVAIEGGSVDIGTNNTHGFGILTDSGDVIVSGSETYLNINFGNEFSTHGNFGIRSYNGAVNIFDATVNIEKYGESGDGVWARSDIRIYGDAQMKIIDWSNSDGGGKCGLQSGEGDIAIGGSSNVDIVSQFIGIYTNEGSVYIGYEWDGTNYIPTGSPTVKINDADSIDAVTPLIDDDFEAGPYGIVSNSEIHLSGGNVTVIGTEKALYADGEGEPITVNMPLYRHRSNTDAAVPATPFSYYPDTPFDVNSVENYKYVKITATGTVTFNSNGAVYDTKTVYLGESIGDAAWPANPTRSRYAFGGWFTGENGSGTELTSATQVDSTITVYAKWTYSGGGGGGGSDSTPPPSQRTISVTETSSEVFIGTAGTIEAEANMDNAFSNSVEVKVTDTDEGIGNFNLSVGDEVYPFDISLYIKGTNEKTKPADGYSVTISLPIPGNLVDKRTSLLVVHKDDNGRVTTLNSRLIQKDGVWYLVFEASEFSPYALVVRNSETYDESTGVPYYLDTKGNKVFIGFAANGKHIAPEGVTVSVMQNDKSFIDITEHLAESYIGFTTERELFFGTGGNKFSPDIGMTRAMFATVIGRLYERSFGEIAESSTHAFIDCDYNVYYGKYVDWAAENEIVAGVGGSKFAPDINITREQMAAILYRFAAFLGILPSEMDDTLEYSDAANISSYAGDAVLYCQTNGIFEERTDGVFAPQETATRAKVTAIIKRFIETVIK